ncbi:hypothetical protein CHARACLAT_033290 [Characodon lateralis]|uniref:Uncharacterized protein n=1 Tax=Characodon lateralis TaxID=208331 RepID=A0ABU7E8J1_9TELE|nr:hypothetical protein [Characodon lateralis]
MKQCLDKSSRFFKSTQLYSRNKNIVKVNLCHRKCKHTAFATVVRHGCPCLTNPFRPAMNHGKVWTAKDTHNPSFKSGRRRTHLSATFDRPFAPGCDVIGPQVRTWKDPAPELGHTLGLHMDPPPSCLLTNSRGAGEKKAALLICIMKEKCIW